MKLLIVLVLVLLAISKAEEEIDWKNVKPISHFREYWTVRGLVSPKNIVEPLKEKGISGRIVGGQIARPGQFPYQVWQ
jgi:chymotrypsin